MNPSEVYERLVQGEGERFYRNDPFYRRVSLAVKHATPDGQPLDIVISGFRFVCLAHEKDLARLTALLCGQQHFPHTILLDTEGKGTRMRSRMEEILAHLEGGPDFCGMTVEPDANGWSIELTWFNGDTDRWRASCPTVRECFDEMDKMAVTHGWIAPRPGDEEGA